MGFLDIFKRQPQIENVDQVKPAKADPYTGFVEYKQAIYRSRQDLAS